jgi:hypothetical protein
MVPSSFTLGCRFHFGAALFSGKLAQQRDHYLLSPFHNLSFVIEVRIWARSIVLRPEITAVFAATTSRCNGTDRELDLYVPISTKIVA